MQFTTDTLIEYQFFVDIAGGGKRPETWATVVICLRQVSLNYIADIIEAEYSDSGSTPKTPGTEFSVVLNNNVHGTKSFKTYHSCFSRLCLSFFLVGIGVPW